MKRSGDKVIGGVCGGIAEQHGLDPLFVRLVFVFLIFTCIPIGLIYSLIWIFTPEKY
jgi:phage shock protein PspC (stress-responsive transcriptional regulator)